MEQNSDTSAPVTPMVEDNKQNGNNGLKIATVIAYIVAVCGIGFGVYGIMQVSNKDSQISNLKTQIEKLETAKKDETSTISANVLANIKTLGDSTYGFKSSNFGNETVYAYIDSNGDLILEKGNKYTIASNVIFADFLWEGNGGAPSLYFVKDDGSVGVVKDVNNTENPVAEEVATTSKAVLVRNITTQGGHKIVIVDTDGNFVDL